MLDLMSFSKERNIKIDHNELEYNFIIFAIVRVTRTEW